MSLGDCSWFTKYENTSLWLTHYEKLSCSIFLRGSQFFPPRHCSPTPGLWGWAWNFHFRSSDLSLAPWGGTATVWTMRGELPPTAKRLDGIDHSVTGRLKYSKWFGNLWINPLVKSILEYIPWSNLLWNKSLGQIYLEINPWVRFILK